MEQTMQSPLVPARWLPTAVCLWLIAACFATDCTRSVGPEFLSEQPAGCTGSLWGQHGLLRPALDVIKNWQGRNEISPIKAIMGRSS